MDMIWNLARYNKTKKQVETEMAGGIYIDILGFQYLNND